MSTTGFVDRDQVMCLNSSQALRFGYAKWLYEEGERRGLPEIVDLHTASLMPAYVRIPFLLVTQNNPSGHDSEGVVW